ncbi:MAG TPA: hemerythrin domain-containing protein [Gaiellaceae bacterium]|nr:hemerythrin domain-containing protein [Gaiellaceae bacterium]
MKRHPALVPLSHDHHHGLVEARRLVKAAGGDAGARAEAGRAFVRFFAGETNRHFREEEEELFPLLARREQELPDVLLRALAEHQVLRGLVRELSAADEPDGGLMRLLGETLEAHIRLEERELFPLIESSVEERELESFAVAQGAGPAEEKTEVVDLRAPEGKGPLWGTASADLNATLLGWPAGGGVGEHVNHERDVLIVVLAGAATLVLDGEPQPLAEGSAVIVPKGAGRSIAAGPEGVRYLSAHLRRAGLTIARASGA